MIVQDALAMEVEAARFAYSLVPREHAVVVTLSGELGAGKTAFVQGLARALGVTVPVTSPTFVIMKIYDLESAKFKHLVHIDAYRLKGEHHLHVLGWDALLADPANIICLEWPERIPEAVPNNAIRLTLRYSGEHERDITYEGGEEATRIT